MNIKGNIRLSQKAGLKAFLLTPLELKRGGMNVDSLFNAVITSVIMRKMYSGPTPVSLIIGVTYKSESEAAILKRHSEGAANAEIMGRALLARVVGGSSA